MAVTRTATERAEKEVHVRVVARFRPPITVEERCDSTAFCCQDSRIVSADQRFSFELDRTFGEAASQEDVYQNVGVPSVTDVLNGYNSTIFTYGHTGSGKTYCLFGPGAAQGQLTGIAPRAVRHIFESIHEEALGGAELVVQCSFLEIYREKLRDVLAPRNKALRLREDPLQGVVADGLTQEPVLSASDALRILSLGNRTRATAPTQSNQHSSRSHGIFCLHVHKRAQQGSESFSAKLAFVDLAGSERVNKTNSTGDSLEEAKKINSSLTALGKVIDALAERRQHIPYRDSVLTRVLEESLGGNCRTTLLVTASTCAQHSDATLTALRFATRTREVQTMAKVNHTIAPDQMMSLVGRLQRELTSMRRQLGRQTFFSGRPSLVSSTWSVAQSIDTSSVASELGYNPCTGSEFGDGSPLSCKEDGEDVGMEEHKPLDLRRSLNEEDLLATINHLETTLITQEEALRQARSLAAHLEESAPVEFERSDPVLMRERWRALWSMVDARALRWRLELERHRSDLLKSELAQRCQHAERLQQQLDASQAFLARLVCNGTPQNCAVPDMSDTPTSAGVASPLDGAARVQPQHQQMSQRSSLRSSRCTPIAGDDRGAGRRRSSSSVGVERARQPPTEKQKQPQTLPLRMRRQRPSIAGTEDSRDQLLQELERKTQQLSEMAADFASSQAQVESLRHEVHVQESLVDQVQRQRWERAENEDDELWQVVHGMARPLAMLLKTESAGCSALDARRGASSCCSESPSTPSTASGLAPYEPTGPETHWPPHGVQEGSPFLQWAFSM